MQKKWGQSAIRGLQENKKGALTKVVGSNRRLAVAPTFRAGELKLRRPLCLSFLHQLAGWTLMAQSLAADLLACGFLWPTPESLSLYDALLSDVMSKILPR